MLRCTFSVISRDSLDFNSIMSVHLEKLSTKTNRCLYPSLVSGKLVAKSIAQCWPGQFPLMVGMYSYYLSNFDLFAIHSAHLEMCCLTHYYMLRQ